MLDMVSYFYFTYVKETTRRELVNPFLKNKERVSFLIYIAKGN